VGARWRLARTGDVAGVCWQASFDEPVRKVSATRFVARSS
jgi:hypothetical protein